MVRILLIYQKNILYKNKFPETDSNSYEVDLHNDGLITFIDSAESLEDVDDQKYYNFTLDVSFTIGFTSQRLIHLYLPVPSNVSFPYETLENPIPFFLPYYDVQVLTLKSSDQTFVRISGQRCRWECEKLSKKCNVLECWENPTLCSGDVSKCLKIDGNQECSSDQPPSGPKNIKERFQEYFSTDFGELFGIGYSEIIVENANSSHQIMQNEYLWECELTTESDVSCFTKVDSKYGGKCLKTLCG